MRKAVYYFCILYSTVVFFAPTVGSAQEDPNTEVISLNQKAMSAYQNMKITEAMETLQEAEGICLQFGLLGHEIALTYLNMGVIEAAGNQNETAATDFFTRAVCVESSIVLDPLVSTPEVEVIFNKAKSKAASPGVCNQFMIGGLEPPPPNATGGGFNAGAPLPPPPPVGGFTGPVPQSDSIRHEAVTEQEKMTPIPLYIMIRPGIAIDKVILFYRTYGEKAYQQFVMAPMGEGYGVTIGCDVLQTFDPTAIEYYIGVMDIGGAVIGFSGNEEKPHTINIVQTLSGLPPAFPDTAPPDKCIAECPPWNPNCNVGTCKQLGDLCDRNSDCCKGMICVEQTCTPGEIIEDSGPFKPHFRIGIAFGTGGGYIPTDYAIPDNRVAEPPYDAWIEKEANQFACTARGYSIEEFKKCYDENVKGLNIHGGIAWAKLQFRLTPMLYITERIMIGLTFRGGLPLATAGNIIPVSPLGLVTFGYRLIGKGKDRFELTAIGGLGGGIMYHKLSFDDCNPVFPVEGHPWSKAPTYYDDDGIVCDVSVIDPVTNEWKGSSKDPNHYEQTYFRKAGYFVGELGLDMYIWVIKNFGINLGVALDFLAAPNFAANGDVQAGVAMRF